MVINENIKKFIATVSRIQIFNANFNFAIKVFKVALKEQQNSFIGKITTTKTTRTVKV